ncbi:MAG: c-type cytochrome, partial [Candidatus Macondimonas sp.]
PSVFYVSGAPRILSHPAVPGSGDPRAALANHPLPFPYKEVPVSEQENNSMLPLVSVLGVMVAFAVFIGVLAAVIGGFARQDRPLDEREMAALKERIAPIGQVRTSDQPPMETANAGESQAAVAPRSGAEVVQQACAACHAAGVLGAPKIGAKGDWEPRLAQGFDTLLKHAIGGIRAMPPKGGNPGLSEDELKAALTEMLKQSSLAP